MAGVIHPPLRFALEIAGLVILGAWAYSLAGPGWLRVVLALAVPIAVGALWGIFRVPNDPGQAVVAIPGPARLALETAVFAAAAAAAARLWGAGPAAVFAALVAVDYLLSWSRVSRLAGW
ncbi:YrdB family protein [Tepidiforma sp.]|uniref:YrdB family protein n=1 Tax=Tepidiforma sp. TaxID=2682230 RepID=UPI002603F91E|nr:YrdB family protein [Tepidiforma sp.]MCX7618472.1 YrdB family protein [Tepidiforma sp.]